MSVPVATAPRYEKLLTIGRGRQYPYQRRLPISSRWLQDGFVADANLTAAGCLSPALDHEEDR